MINKSLQIINRFFIQFINNLSTISKTYFQTYYILYRKLQRFAYQNEFQILKIKKSKKKYIEGYNISIINMDNFDYALKQQQLPQLSTPSRVMSFTESMHQPLFVNFCQKKDGNLISILKIVNENAGENNIGKILQFNFKLGWNKIIIQNQKNLTQLIKYDQQLFQNLSIITSKNNVRKQCFQATLNNLQNQNGILIKKLHEKRQIINILKIYSLEKHKNIGALLIKKNNLKSLKQKIDSLKATRTKVCEMKQYQQILSNLKNRRRSPISQRMVSKSPMKFKIYKSLHENQLKQLMKKQINNIKVSQYQWKQDDSFILIKIAGMILKSGLKISQDNFSISSICSNYMKLKLYLKVQKRSQSAIQDALRSKFASLLIANLSEPSSNKVTYSIYMQAKNIMQQNQQENKFFNEFIEGYQKDRKVNFQKFREQLLSISWQGLPQVEILNWIDNFKEQYSWLSEDGINSELEEIRVIITKKIIRPLLVDFLHYEKIWSGMVFFGSSIEVLDLNRFNQKDLHKNQMKQFYTYRIWHKYQNLYHKIHPLSTDIQISMLSIDLSQEEISILKQKKYSPKKVAFQTEVISHNIIDYLQYSSLISSLWAGLKQQLEIVQLWSQLIAQYFLRRAPHMLCQLSSQKHMFYHEIIKKYEQISSISSRQKYLEGYLEYKKLNEVQEQELYNYVMKNQFSSFNKEFLDKCAERVECFDQLKKNRGGVYSCFYCSLCKVWKN